MPGSSSSPPSPIVLPITTIQPTFLEVLRDVEDGLVPEDTFWVSCYKEGEESVHRKVKAQLDERDRNKVNLSVYDGDIEERGATNVSIGASEDGNYSISCRSLEAPSTRIVTPTQQYADGERSNAQRPQRITAFDVAPDLSQFATGFLDGSVFLYAVSRPSLASSSRTIPRPPEVITTPAKIRRTSKPHVSTITSLQFFPSSRVLLTSSADFALSILPADLPPESERVGSTVSSSNSSTSTGTRIQPARTLKGHTRTITSTGIIGRGRNIISSSLDSTVRLWDVSSGTSITSYYAVSPITCTSLADRGVGMGISLDGDDTPASPTAPPPADDREQPETATKIVYCGLQNGGLQVFDLGSRKPIFKFSPPLANPRVAISAMAHSETNHLLVMADARGVVRAYDTRALSQSLSSTELSPLFEVKRNGAGIDSLALLEGADRNQAESLLVLGANDGLPYISSLIPDGPGVRAELVGSDCDAVRSIKVRLGDGSRREVWTAGDDAVVRRYFV